MASFSSESLATVSGTVTAWLPIPTPWLSIAACSSQIYEQRAGLGGNFIAFDPLFGESIVPSAIPCLPTEVTSSWYQSNTATTTVLGPTFVCPGAYTGVETILIDVSTQHILCCPSSYTLNIPITGKGAFPSQCTSLLTPGETVTYQSTTPSGPWGVATTVVAPTAAVTTGPTVVFGMHVNGFNVISTAAGSSTTLQSNSAVTFPSSSQSISSSGQSPSTATTSKSDGSQSPSSTPSIISVTPSSLSTAAAAGIGVGITAVLIAAIIGAFFFWRRKRTMMNRELETKEQGVRFNYPTGYQELHGTQALQELDGAGFRGKGSWRQPTFELQ